ncbi:MAG: DUF481 domain-containing protein [Phycisphaeraceae bacterium]|nr:MAG: DUF481 domain-containing protein [Phycisphaeraceae bacterium]
MTLHRVSLKIRSVLLCAVPVAALSLGTGVGRAEMAIATESGGRSGSSEPTRETVSLSDRSILGQFVTLRLDNGDVLRGTIASVTQGEVLLQHAVLGEVMIPRTRIAEAFAGAWRTRVEPSPVKPGEPTVVEIEIPEAPPDEQVPALATAPPPVVVVSEKSRAKWLREIELGLTGAQGNSDRANFQGGFRMSRTTDADTFQLNTRYRLDTSGGDRTANRFLANARNDWGLSHPDWSLFLQSGVELDEFAVFDARWTGGGGFGYRFINTPSTVLRGRLGFGFARDFGGLDDDYNPEVITGLELSHRFTDRQLLVASAEVFPEVDAFDDFRSILRAEWQLRLENSKDVFLRIGAEHRYDTDSPAEKRSDLDYFVRLVFGF